MAKKRKKLPDYLSYFHLMSRTMNWGQLERTRGVERDSEETVWIEQEGGISLRRSRRNLPENENSIR